MHILKMQMVIQFITGKLLTAFLILIYKRGMKPLAQIGFMPEAFHQTRNLINITGRPGASYKEVFTGWAYPPNDYNKWRELIYQWVKHCVERYGKKEVESWWWEVWNEPNIGYWQGTVEEYCKMYDYAADGLLKALPTAKIGGCDITGGGSKFLTAFINHCLSETNYATGKIRFATGYGFVSCKRSTKIC